jgi:integrase
VPSAAARRRTEARHSTAAQEEAAHLVAVAAAEFPHWHPWIVCALRTGRRAGELLALQWGHLDPHGGFILVQRNLLRGVLTPP